MNRQNRYLEDNDNLLTKIDNLIQHSRALRNNIARNNQQKGGAIQGFVSLDTPVNNMTGGSQEKGSIDSEFARTDASLKEAERLLNAFKPNDEMIGGGCGCGSNDVYPIHTADCGSRSYQSGGYKKTRSEKYSESKPKYANLLSDLENDLNSIDSLLSKF